MVKSAIGQNAPSPPTTGLNVQHNSKKTNLVNKYIHDIRQRIQKQNQKEKYKHTHSPFSKTNLFERDDQDFFIHGKYNPKTYSDPSTKRDPHIPYRRRKVSIFTPKQLRLFYKS